MITPTRLTEITNGFTGKRIAVIGDLMLDRYVFGSATRISQEAPVPIVHIKRENQTLGGAANVMRNIVTLGGQVAAFGLVGDDDAGQQLRDLLSGYHVDQAGVLADGSRRTIQKKRVIADAQQLIRIDYEDLHPVADELQREIVTKVKEQICSGSVDGIIFEDYNKGLLESGIMNEIVSEAKLRNIIVGLDPHPGHPVDVKGLTLVTPNRAEAFGLVGIYKTDPVRPISDDSNLHTVAGLLREKWDPEYLMITLGADGMILYDRQNDYQIIPTRAREVFDVSGAGDTVIATFMLSYLAGADSREAAELANHAAGVVVGKVGTVSVDIEELKHSFDEDYCDE